MTEVLGAVSRMNKVAFGKTIEIVAAHPLEVSELEKRLGLAPFKEIAPSEFLLFNTRIRILISGIGKDKVKSSVRSLLGKESQSSILLNVGFAGALDPNLNCASWLLVDRIQNFIKNSSIKTPFSPELALLKEAQEYFSSGGGSYRQGRLVTVDDVCSNREEKELLFSLTEALAVDMEAYYVAKIAAENGRAFLALKIISDEVGDSAENAIKSKGRFLSRCIAEMLSDFVIKLASFSDEDKRGNSHP